MPYYFTVGEANALLPKVKRMIREVRFWKRRAEALRRALEHQAMDIMERRRMRSLYAAAHRRMREALERLEALGCIVRDVEVGLVDFPALRFGEMVYLCWREDEPQLQYWHGPREGFSGRKPLWPNLEALV